MVIALNTNGDLSLILLSGHSYFLFYYFSITFTFYSKSHRKSKSVVLLHAKVLFKALKLAFMGLLTIITKYFQIHYIKFSSYTSLKDVEYCRILKSNNF